MPYEVRARPYSETSAACAAAVAFDDAPRVLTPTQFDDDDDEEEEEEDDSRDGAATPPPPPPAPVESVTVVDDDAGGDTAPEDDGAGAPDGVAVEICREGDEAWLSAAVRKATMSFKATGPPVNGSVHITFLGPDSLWLICAQVNGTAAVGRIGVGGLSVEINQGLSVVLEIADGAIRGRTVAILRELADVFAAPDALRSWWPGPVDTASCDEAVQVLDLLRRNGRGEGKWLRFAVDVAGTLRKDGDDLILAGTATQGVRVDAAGNARDVLLDASILGDAIRRRRLLEAAAAASK